MGRRTAVRDGEEPQLRVAGERNRMQGPSESRQTPPLVVVCRGLVISTMMFSRACAPLCAAASSCTAFSLALICGLAWCAALSLKLIWLIGLLAASLLELMWHYGGQRSLQALWFGVETSWWLYVLPHAWLADRIADYMLACRWLAASCSGQLGKPKALRVGTCRRYSLAVADD